METKPGYLTRSFMFVGFLVVASWAYGADSTVRTLNATTLVNGCKSQLRAKAFEAVAIKGRSGATYSVRLVKMPATRRDPAKSVVIDIQRGPDSDVEIPHISAVCVRNVPTSISNKGDFQFQSAPTEETPVIVYLDRAGTKPPLSKKTDWNKAKPNQNIGVAIYSDSSKDPPQPGFNDPDWPCKDANNQAVPKSVDASAADTISFSMCANHGATVTYVYEVRMQQVGSDGSTIDVEIDPLIYNRP